MAAMRRGFTTFSILFVAASALGIQKREGVHSSMSTTVNPIRKVVNLLRNMQQKVKSDAKTEEELFEKFMCYCKTNGGGLEKSVADAKLRIPEVQSSMEAAQSALVQMQGDIKQAKTDRDAAKKTLAESSAIREREAAAFAAKKTNGQMNIKAIDKAIASLQKNKASSFLQSPEAALVQKIAMATDDLVDQDREDLVAFISNKGGNQSPEMGSIIGIMKTLKETLIKELQTEIEDEKLALNKYKETAAAKGHEVKALQAAIESKLVRTGKLRVEVTHLKEDLEDTKQMFAEDSKFLADLNKNCGSKNKDWEKTKQMRAAELFALSDTIKVLNNDEALDLFKKTLPSAASSFMQVQITAATLRKRALMELNHPKAPRRHPKIDLIQMALSSKKIGFDKILKMVDEMISVLREEQRVDDRKKDYCTSKFDSLEDKMKTLEWDKADIQSSLEDAKESLAAMKGDIKALEKSIQDLDKSVVEATKQRQDENKEYKELMASNAAAKQLLEYAENRLNKFYNPKLYVEPKKEDAPDGSALFIQVALHALHKEAPPPPPEAVEAYKKKTEENAGVMQMISTLMLDLDKDTTEAETTEKLAQEAYEQMTVDSKEKRAVDTKALAEKVAAKADLEAGELSSKSQKKAVVKEMYAMTEVTQALHKECDFLLKYFQVRKEGRSDEIDSMMKAKAVLSGADYTLLQTNTHSWLRVN